LFIDQSFRGREGLLGLCDDFGVGSILHDPKSDLGLSWFRECEVAACFGFAALQKQKFTYHAYSPAVLGS
jgi:hypothetical protein